jgi:hypothetical protein
MYQLEEQTVEISLEVAGVEVSHRFTRPTKAQLVERDNRIRHEEVSLDDNQTETIYDDDAANVGLWDACATHVKGYDTGAGSSDWTALTDELRAVMPSEHKIKAVGALYTCSAMVEKASTNGHGFPLMGATEVKVRLSLGDASEPYAEVMHVLRRPTEGEWTAYRRGIQRIVQVRGTKQPRFITHANLGASTAFYDALVTRIEGATIAGAEFNASTREEFLRAVDPIHKRVIVRAFAEHWGADLKD